MEGKRRELVYGSTECTISCIVANAGTSSVISGEIGEAVGSKVWIINPSDVHELVKPGEVGELVVEGPLVSPAYLNNDTQTEAKYIKRPKWSTTQTRHRMYRTGDLVRCIPENETLVYVSRVDNQVKIHGQRLELGK